MKIDHRRESLQALSVLLRKIRVLSRREEISELNSVLTDASSIIHVIKTLSVNNENRNSAKELHQLETIFIEIIDLGLAHIKALASRLEWNYCFVEADHIHNIPEFLASNNTQDRQHYIHSEIPCYLNANSPNAFSFLPLFAKLKSLDN